MMEGKSKPRFDRDRFLKVLALAESNHDGEALAAIRRATAMARGSGMSLGEAVGNGGGCAQTRTSGHAAELRLLRRRIAELEVQLALKEIKDRYYEGKICGYKEGRQSAVKEFKALDPFKTGYSVGYRAGQESETQSINNAYNRGFADGKRMAEAPAPKAKTSRRRVA